MAIINVLDKLFLENFLELDSDTVLGISHHDLEKMIYEATNNQISLDHKKYKRKKYNSDANIVRRILSTESNELVANILDKLVSEKEKRIYSKNAFITNYMIKIINHAKEITTNIKDSQPAKLKHLIGVNSLFTIIIGIVLASYVIHIDVRATLYTLDGGNLFPSFEHELKFQDAVLNFINLFFSVGWSILIVIIPSAVYDIAYKTINRIPWVLITLKSRNNITSSCEIIKKFKIFIVNNLLRWVAVFGLTLVYNFPRAFKSYIYVYVIAFIVLVLLIFSQLIYSHELNSFLEENPSYCKIIQGKIKTKELINVDVASNSIYYWTESGTLLQMRNESPILIPIAPSKKKLILNLCNKTHK